MIPKDNVKLVDIDDASFKAQIRCSIERIKNHNIFGIKIILNREPEFYFDSYGGDSFKEMIFMKRVRDEKLEGLFEDGKFSKNNQYIEKLYEMSRLGLMPIDKKLPRENELKETN